MVNVICFGSVSIEPCSVCGIAVAELDGSVLELGFVSALNVLGW